MPPILVFDVNESLLDLAALDPHFEQNFGNVAVRKEWFSQVLQMAFVTAITGAYSDFSTIGKAALDVIEQRHQKPLSPQQRSLILETMRKLPPHPDAKDGLEWLRDGGLRLVALTNSPPEMVDTQLRSAGLRPYFERVFSADSVRRFKPAPEPYRMAARELGVGTDSLLLVAAHSWDIAGAMRAGCGGAFLARPGQVLDALTPKPNFIAPDLRDLARQILGAARKAGAS